MQFCSILPIDASTPGQNEPGSDGNKRVLHIPQSSSITGTFTVKLFCVISRILVVKRCNRRILQPQPTEQVCENTRARACVCVRIRLIYSKDISNMNNVPMIQSFSNYSQCDVVSFQTLFWNEKTRKFLAFSDYLSRSALKCTQRN